MHARMHACILQASNAMALLQSSSDPFAAAIPVYVQKETDEPFESGSYVALLQMDSTLYTQDGFTDIHGRPSIKAKTGVWKACLFILGTECCERLAYYGIATNLVTYLTMVLNQSNATAATSVNNWSGTCYIMPFIGAFLADAYWGRYWTIAGFALVYLMGLILLTLSAAIPGLNLSTCTDVDASTCKATTGQLAILYMGLYLIALGTGGIKPCVASFGANQFDDNDEAEAKKKSSFFNWFYFCLNIGALLSSSIIVYIQDNYSWAWGFGIPAAAMGIAIGVFFFGSSMYRHQKPGGSPLTRILQVCVATFRKCNIIVSSDTSELYETKECSILGSRKLEHTNELLCLDRAATVTDHTAPKTSPWELCTVTQVEEVKLMIRILPIWATTIVFAAAYSQMSTLFVEQGATMDTSLSVYFDIPAASLSTFETLSVMIWIPLYDFVIIPIARRFTGNHQGFTHIQRMGIGLIISVMSMVAAALVEMKRLEIAREYDLLEDTDTPVPMSIFWQVPQYFLVGASAVFTFIGQIEFFYEQSPDATRSLYSALSLAATSLGNYLSALIVTIVTTVTTRGGSPGWIPNNLNIGHIDYFFWLLAGLSMLNFIVFLACAHWCKYKKVDRAAYTGR